jgi:ATP-dependent exoDNAse (exonuclease V) beta subunit
LVDPSRDGGAVGLRLVSLDGSESMPALDYQRLLQRRRSAEALEEQRIIYVAMTRARERLLLSAAVDFENWPVDTASAPSIGWLAPALLPDLSVLLGGDQQTTVQRVPDGDGARVRCWVRRADEGLPFPAHSRAGLSRGEDDRPTPEGSGQTGAARTHSQLSLPGMHTAPAVSRFPNRPRTLTYSSLAKFERCGYRYYLEDVLGLPERREKTEGHGGMLGRSRGQIVHRLLERIDYRDPQPPEPSDVLSTAAELALTVEHSESRELAALLQAMTASELAKRLATASWVSREQPFAFTLRGIQELATGTLDLSARDRDGGWLVVDYKSDRVGQGEDLETLVRRKYATQRLLYGLAALHGGAPTVEVIHWFLERPGDRVSVHYRANDRDRLEGELLDRTRGLRSEGFNVSHTPHRELCAGCPGRRGLCSWGEAETMRERPEE